MIQSTTDIENLMLDLNKSLSSLATSVLLKICKEENIEKLLALIYDVINPLIIYLFFIEILTISIKKFLNKLKLKCSK